MEQIFFSKQGTGDVIVLIHGFCEDSRVWDLLVPQLAQKHTVITIDMPGFGKSELNSNEGTVSLENMADALEIKLKELSISKCTLIGHSMGGYLTLVFAKKYPELLNGLGLFHSTATADTDFKKKNRLKHIDFVERNGVEPFVKTLIPTLFSENNKQLKQVERSVKMAVECKAKGIINALHAMRNRPERLTVLKESKVPVLLIAGADDTVVLAKDIALQASLPEQCQFELLENSGHMGMLEEPENSVKIIKQFLAFVKVQ